MTESGDADVNPPRGTATSARNLEYVRRISSTRESDVLRRLRAETATLPMRQMQIGADQGQLLGLLAASVGAQRAIEVGVFTGYSSICVASVLPEDGLLLACDTSEEWTAIARRYWREASVDGRIELRLAPAAETLAAELAAGRSGTFDFAFIDADKTGYPGYWEQCVELVRSGGIVAVDNALQGERVADPTDDDPSAAAVRATNERAFADERVQSALVTVGDGVLISRKG
ncbi:MAG: class I SAM-dependent methyltransferase [Planctomycetota bacterium]